MNTRYHPVRLWLVLLLAAGPACAEIYRWTDAQGTVHFSSQKPPGDAAEAETFRSGGHVSFVGGGPRRPARATTVRLFTTSWCPVCKKAEAYLKQRGTPFEALDIERSRAAKAEYDRLGGQGVPLILVGERRLDGFSRGELEEILKGAGL